MEVEAVQEAAEVMVDHAVVVVATVVAQEEEVMVVVQVVNRC